MESAIQLPRVRQDLNLYPAPGLRDGSPSWTLHDPLRNRYFRIGWQEFELLSRLHLHSVHEIIEAVRQIGVVEGVEERLSRLIQFLNRNELVEGQQLQNKNHQPQKRLSLSSLFMIKVPLFRPDRLLSKIYPWLSGLFRPAVAVGLGGLGIFSLLIIIQQWDLFLATFTDFQNPLGISAFVAAILFGKVVHELGHALMSKHYGLQVPTFGVAFLFFWPVFYTDGSNGWQLRSRRARLMIGGAGVMAESALAILATLSWIWLPEGLPKLVAFTLAVTTWGTTLLINLNPFMRFDGYFLLSDWWEVPNLQVRAFALGKEQLRSLLFGIDAPRPLPGEDQKQTRRLIYYAWATWVYRLFLYLGLALLAYHYLFKLFGVLLLAAELGVLVVRPVAQEMKQYWGLRKQFRWVRSNRIAALIFSVGVALLIVPWKSHVDAPAIWKQGAIYPVSATETGEVVAVNLSVGDRVSAGEYRIELAFPKLDYEREMLFEQINEQREIVRSGEMGRERRQQRLIEQQKLEQLNSKWSEVVERINRAQIAVPVAGRVIDITDSIAEGEWVAAPEVLFTVSNEETQLLEGWFHETDLEKLVLGASGRFYPEYAGGSSTPVQVKQIAVSGSPLLEDEDLLLASTHGGALPVREDEERRARLQESYYRVQFSLLEPLMGPVGELRGTVVVESEPSRLLVQGWEWFESVLIQESGF